MTTASALSTVTDLYFTDAGDFVEGDNGDILDTKNYQFRGAIQRIITRVMSTRGDWRLQNSVGANIMEFRGKPNNRAIGELIKTRITSELVNGKVLRTNNFTVDVTPISPTQIAIIVAVGNQRRETVLAFSYDFKDNHIVPRNS